MKTTFSVLVFSVLFSLFSNAQQKYGIVDNYKHTINYGVSSWQSKIPIFITTDSQTKSIVPFNAISNDPLGSMTYLVDATTVSVTTQIKRDSLSYYRYSIFENDTTIIKSNALLNKIDFVWPDGSDLPGYLTMNLGISDVRNKKITIKIYRLPEQSKITTVIIYNKILKPAKLIQANLLSKQHVIKTKLRDRSDPIYNVTYDASTIKNDSKFGVDPKTWGIHISIKKTDLDFVYQVILKNKSNDKENIVFLSNNWNYDSYGGNPSNFIPASHFNIAGTYELIIVPILGKSSDMTVVDVKPIKLSFTILPPPITFNTMQVTICFVITVLFAAIVFYLIKRNNKEKLITANRQAEMAQTELNQVRSQLNPHFVFNALSGIQNLMNQHEVEKANSYLNKFARLTRNILDGKQLIALKDEYKLLDDYLSMEKLRFNFNYEIELETEADILEVMIPTMLLQPFVENAVKHSMSILGDQGKLLMAFKSVQKDLILAIKDNGKGFDVKKVQEGFGLPLCKKRIDLLNQMYQECPISLEINSSTTGTTIIITLNNWL